MRTARSRHLFLACEGRRAVPDEPAADDVSADLAPDAPLDAVGVAQAERLAAAVLALGVARVVSGAGRGEWQTAHVAALAAAVPHVVDSRLAGTRPLAVLEDAVLATTTGAPLVVTRGDVVRGLVAAIEPGRCVEAGAGSWCWLTLRSGRWAVVVTDQRPAVPSVPPVPPGHVAGAARSVR
ncbi:histidine phosphatase family protein [Cellulomonas sp. HZM]|uniref:histidine phosphatase family protein n=1 Tax=Cellulomonas sp. HZM TaxID=1454010 RepID=UPI0004939F5F|nr:histidine phosphatase family protein [Cellulomonas sp. HZM]